MKESILKLRKEGKTYNEIIKLIGCSKSLISYYCNPNSKETIKKGKENRKNGIYLKRVSKNENCLNCNSKIENHGKKYCCQKCSSHHRSKLTYEYYLNNQLEFSDKLYYTRCLKPYILDEQDNKCNICFCDNIHNNKPLVFILDHIDGNAKNNMRNNLRCICPNCDSQLDTYKSKNKNSARNYIRYGGYKK